MTAGDLWRDERGASLIVALAFVTFMGVFSVAILAFTGVGSTTTSIVDARSAQRYAADAGMEHGIANLVADGYACRLPSSARTWSATTVNAHAVTYACAAPPALLGEYGAIVGPGGIAVSRANARSLTIQYEASLHAAGPVTFGTPAEQTSTVDGNVTLAGACPGENLAAAPPYSCSGAASVPALPAVAVYVPTVAAAPPTTAGACTTLHPGRYGTGGLAIPTFDRRNSYYLASGVYYIDGAAMILRGAVFGGAPGPGESQAMTATSPCRTTDPPGTGYSGSGVAFVLGGAGSLRVENAASRVELFARAPGGLDAGATPGLGVWAGSGASVLNGASTYADTTNPAPIVSTDHGALNLVVHGVVFTPTAGMLTSVHDNIDAGRAPVFAGGLVTSSLQISVANTDDAKVMTVAGSIPPRRPLLTATVPGRHGAPTVVVSATIRPDGGPLVSTWRIS